MKILFIQAVLALQKLLRCLGYFPADREASGEYVPPNQAGGYGFSNGLGHHTNRTGWISNLGCIERKLLSKAKQTNGRQIGCIQFTNYFIAGFV